MRSLPHGLGTTRLATSVRASMLFGTVTPRSIDGSDDPATYTDREAQPVPRLHGGKALCVCARKFRQPAFVCFGVARHSAASFVTSKPTAMGSRLTSAEYTREPWMQDAGSRRAKAFLAAGLAWHRVRNAAARRPHCRFAETTASPLRPVRRSRSGCLSTFTTGPTVDNQ